MLPPLDLDAILCEAWQTQLDVFDLKILQLAQFDVSANFPAPFAVECSDA
ncbi:hypothetical protein NKI50_29720 [Mesorhizobium sp. M0563]